MRLQIEMLTLDKVVSYINPNILKELFINKVDEIIQYALVLYLHSKSTRYLGKDFWEEINANNKTKDKMIVLDHAVNRFTAEFIKDFCNEDGSINWEKLVQFNSGTEER